MKNRRKKSCQYGVMGIVCGVPAVTRRLRPNGSEMWDVCEKHGDVLDRLRKNKVDHNDLLEQLKGM